MKVELLINHYDIRILIEGLPHVYISRNEFVGFTSWNDDDSMYVIEYVTKYNKIRTEYDTKEKWLAVLTELNNKL